MTLISPLNGVRVLDLTRVLAGPYCTMLLGDLGAQVLKIEQPGIGDVTRSWLPPKVGAQSCYFVSVNRNKKSVTLNIKHDEGARILKQLVSVSDVLVENFIPGTMDRCGLGYDHLASVNPSLIYCSITGYGPTGPYAKRGGYDVIAAGVGGLMSITGTENGEPVKVGVAMTDLATGLYAYGSIMAALLQRTKTGLGQRIDCNLLSTQVSALVNVASNYLNAGIEGRRLGTAHESIVPYQCFKTSDSHIIIGTGTDLMFKELCKKTKYWLEIFDHAEASFPYGPVNNMQETFSDPQVMHNNLVQVLTHPTTGDKCRVVGPAVSFSGSDVQVRLAPPLLSEHTKSVLQELLGFSDEQILELQRKAVI